MGEKILYVFFGDGDYSPLLLATKSHGVVMFGDSTHNNGYEDFAYGFSRGTGFEIKWINVNNMSDLAQYEALMNEVNGEIYGYFESRMGEFQ